MSPTTKSDTQLESKFQADLVKELHLRFPGCIVLHNDSSYIQGIPDLLILLGNRWAALEVKASLTSRLQPNQAYYVLEMNNMSYASVIAPENMEEVLNEVAITLGAAW